MYHPLKLLNEGKLNPINLKIFYFTLEMAAEDKMLQAMSNILYDVEGIRVAPVDLKSTRANKVLDEKTLEAIERNKHLFEQLAETVTFIDSIKNPYGINKFCKEYALKNGTQHKKTVEFINNKTGEKFAREIDDYYEADNPDEYVIIIIDHISLITPEEERGQKMGLHQSISRLTSDYLIALRNKYKMIPVVVQQQASSQESLENIKGNRIRPTLDGLADNKLTQRDADLILGLFSPYRFEIPEYMGYDVTFFRDNLRFLEILGGRQGGGGTISPLYFDGAVNVFKELPTPNDTLRMQGVRNLINKIRTK